MGKSSIQGVGINDANYQVCPKVDGKRVMCPFYRKWTNMLERCYSKKYQDRYPTYKDCTVCDDWLLFSNFKLWMEHQDWQGKSLDKDIVITGNKIYSPETCIFVLGSINNLLTDCGASRGKYPVGVHWCNQELKFVAKSRVYGKRKQLGYFSTSEAASSAYNEFKSNLVASIALKQNQPLMGYLLRISGEINERQRV